MILNIRQIYYFVIFSVWMVVMLGVSVVFAQDNTNPITAQVDISEATMDDVITLTVSVGTSGNGSTPQPQMPSLDDFNIIRSSTSSQISIINGQMTAQQSTTYHLQPIQAGTLTIGAFSITIAGQTYTTDSY